MPETKILNLKAHYASGSQIAFKVQLPPPEQKDGVLICGVALDGGSSFTGLDLFKLIGGAILWGGVWTVFRGSSPQATWTLNAKDQIEIVLSVQPVVTVQHEVEAFEWTQGMTTPRLVDAVSFQIDAAQPQGTPGSVSDLEEIIAQHGSLPVSLRARAAQRVRGEEVNWIRILAASKALSYHVYVEHVKANFCANECLESGARSRHSLSGVRAYERLRDVTEGFVQSTCQAIPAQFISQAVEEALARLDRKPDVDESRVSDALPQNLLAASARLPRVAEAYELACLQPLEWCPVELIWSYWMEAGKLVQTMNAIARRFQNLRAGHGRPDPLAAFELGPLRNLNHLLFGYVQDDRRLTVLRRAYEYNHQYGIQLDGRAVRSVRPADRRSKFIESFHNLLLRCTQYFRQDDDLTVRADAFPVLNAIKETHYLIAQGFNNQVGDLPPTSRQEMLLEMWLLGTSETHEFLHTPDMVPYPERWMGPVDAMKNIQGWEDTSVVHFRDLANVGEVLVQAIRYGNWSNESDGEVARTWAMLFRPYVQTYWHAYRAVTGIDLTSDSTDPRQLLLRAASPSDHLQRRLAEQTARAAR